MENTHDPFAWTLLDISHEHRSAHKMRRNFQKTLKTSSEKLLSWSRNYNHQGCLRAPTVLRCGWSDPLVMLLFPSHSSTSISVILPWLSSLLLLLFSSSPFAPHISTVAPQVLSPVTQEASTTETEAGHLAALKARPSRDLSAQHECAAPKATLQWSSVLVGWFGMIVPRLAYAHHKFPNALMLSSQLRVKVVALAHSAP